MSLGLASVFSHFAFVLQGEIGFSLTLASLVSKIKALPRDPTRIHAIYHEVSCQNYRA